MVAPRKKSIGKCSPAWHATFVSWLPLIRRRAAIAFRDLLSEAREEAVEEVKVCTNYRQTMHAGGNSGQSDRHKGGTRRSMAARRKCLPCQSKRPADNGCQRVS